MDPWLLAAREALAGVSGLPAHELELSDEDERLLLRLARIAAHDSNQRTNAPLLCYLVGLAAGKTNAKLDAIAAAVPAKGGASD